MCLSTKNKEVNLDKRHDVHCNISYISNSVLVSEVFKSETEEIISYLKINGVISNDRKLLEKDILKLHFLNRRNADILREYTELFKNFPRYNLSYLVTLLLNNFRNKHRIFVDMSILRNYIFNNNINSLKKYLENIYLEYIEDEVIDFLVNKINNKEKTIEDIIFYHNKHPNRNLLSALL